MIDLPITCYGTFRDRRDDCLRPAGTCRGQGAGRGQTICTERLDRKTSPGVADGEL